MNRLRSITAAVLAVGSLLVFFQNCAEELTPPSTSQYGSNDGGGDNTGGTTAQGLTINDPSVSPGAKAVINLTLSSPLDSDLQFYYSTVDRTALGGTHFAAIAAAAGLIPAGQTSVAIEIPTINSTTVDYTGREFGVSFTFNSTQFSSRTATVRFNNFVSSIAGTYHLSSFSGSLSSGERHTCATKNGALYCWGLNANGQLGTGNTTNSNIPAPVAGFSTGVQAVAAGYRHSCAIRNNALFCWGLAASHQLGTGSTVQATFPQAVFDMGSDVQAVSAGVDHTCAIRAGALYCWGGNGNAQVGHANGTQQVPYRVPGFETGVTSVLASNQVTCATKGGALYCWGANGDGQLGLGNTTTSTARNPTTTVLAPIANFATGVTNISGHGNTVCAIKSGALSCWGANNRAQVGNNATADVSTPFTHTTLAAPMIHVATGQFHSCAIRNGFVYCWGNNSQGQLGYGNTTAKLQPDVPVPLILNTGEAVELVVAGGMGNDANVFPTTCARTNRQRIFCWGYNGNGQIGDGTTANKNAPVEITLFSQP